MEFLQTCATGNLEAVERLIPADWEGKDRVINYAHPINGWTGLMWAVKRNNVPVARFLVASGANVNAVNAKGSSVADLVQSEEMREILKLQVEIPVAVQQSTFIPNYLVDAASLPPIDKIIAGASSKSDEQDDAKTTLPEYIPVQHTEASQPRPTTATASSNIDISNLQEIIVYLASRYDTEEKKIIGAVHIAENTAITLLLQQAFAELDILLEPDSKIPTVISRLDNQKRVIPISKKQYDHLAVLHFKHGNSLIIHQN
ncbi:UNVERIFIED_CONTAM: hypothetical protein HDU68_012623 [Siphonaria sp. JEL0065]|nr:hypothetical protein HDU68_012623 [Siphonaria sp. JEL0065]